MDHAVKDSYPFDSSQTAGQMLRGLREHAGVELEVLAAALKVPPQKIDALEQDNLAALPAAFFARGLAANICRFLNADPHPVLAKLPDDKPRIATDDESINAPFSPHRFGSGMRQGGVPPWALAGAGLLALGALVLFLYPTISNKLSAARAASAPAQAASAAEATASQPASASAPLTNLQAQPVTVPSNLQPATQSASAAGPATAASAVAAGVTQGLNFHAVGETWVQVRSPDGKTLYERTLKSGQDEQVAIAAYPVRVTIGRAENMQLSDRGQPFDLASVASIGVARFELK